MKDPFDHTKVVVRHLPPSISESTVLEQIDGSFSGRYRWVSFRSGKNSQKNQRYSRVYIDFKSPEDVLEFAEFFNGHTFVNEKGAQFKTLVEYAPSQRVPKPSSKKDGREGTILKDPEYLEFLDLLAKPVENLPSAEIQLERREAERAGSAKDPLIITPLMDFVRQKRAAKSGSQRSSTNGKISRRSAGPPGTFSSGSTKRSSEKRRVSTSMYVLRGSTKNASGKDKSTYILMPRREEHEPSDKSVAVCAATGTDILEDENGAEESGKRKVLLLKGKEQEVSYASGVVSQQQPVTSPVRNSTGSTAFKPNHRREGNGRLIRSILSNKEARQGQSAMVMVQSEQQLPTPNLEKDKRPPRPTSIRSVLKEHISSTSPLSYISGCDTNRVLDDKLVGNDLHGVISVNEKQDKRTRNKDRPDRGVWTALRRPDGSRAGNETMSLLHSQTAHFLSDSSVATGISKHGDDVVEDTDSINSSFTDDIPLCHGEMKVDLHSASRSGEIKTFGSRSSENGFHKHVGRRVPSHGLKEVDVSLNLTEGKPSKRGGPIVYGSHEKQVWVQKSGSGS